MKRRSTIGRTAAEGVPLHFADRLAAAVTKARNPVLVGIDPRVEQLPPGYRDRFGPGLAGTAEAFEQFSRDVIDVVAGKAPAVKFQCAFFENLGAPGMTALASAMRYASDAGLLVIADGKRNDIGATAEAYAQAYFGTDTERPWHSDALTINPYLGGEGIAPFVSTAAKNGCGVFVLVRTSNPSAGDFQDLVADGQPVYRHVARRLKTWMEPERGQCGYSLVGAVVGATYPEQLAELRDMMPQAIFLVPGYGAQGGTAKDVAAAFDADGHGTIVNNSRGLVFAYRAAGARERFGDDWQRAIDAALTDMADRLADETPAGRLRK